MLENNLAATNGEVYRNLFKEGDISNVSIAANQGDNSPRKKIAGIYIGSICIGLIIAGIVLRAFYFNSPVTKSQKMAWAKKKALMQQNSDKEIASMQQELAQEEAKCKISTDNELKALAKDLDIYSDRNISIYNEYAALKTDANEIIEDGRYKIKKLGYNTKQDIKRSLQEEEAKNAATQSNYKQAYHEEQKKIRAIRFSKSEDKQDLIHQICKKHISMAPVPNSIPRPEYTFIVDTM